MRQWTSHYFACNSHRMAKDEELDVGDPDVVSADSEEGASMFVTREGRFLEDMREAVHPRLSTREAARRAGMSDTRWRQIVRGWQKVGDEVYVPVRAPAKTIVRMARVVGADPLDLEHLGRTDAAVLMADQGAPVGAGVDPELLEELAGARPEEIEKVKAYLRGIKDSR